MPDLDRVLTGMAKMYAERDQMPTSSKAGKSLSSRQAGHEMGPLFLVLRGEGSVRRSR